MATQVYPTGAETRPPPSYGSISAIGVGSTGDVLNADPSSYVQAAGPAIGVWQLPDQAVTPLELVTVSLAFEARPSAGYDYQGFPQIEGTLIDSNGGVWAQTMWSRSSNPATFSAGTVVFGSITTWTRVNDLRLRLRAINGSVGHLWEVNDARLVISDEFTGPSTVAVSPTGAIADNTPTVTWTATIDEPAVELEAYGRVRIFNDDQYSAGGFDPATSPATWDSGLRDPSHQVASVPLPADTYRAYVATYQWVFPGDPWVRHSDQPQAIIQGSPAVLQAGAYSSPVSFTVVTAAPIVVGPTIKVDAVRDLTDTQRQVLLEPFRPLPRATLFSADGVAIRDLNVVSGSVVLDAAAEVRGSVSLVCTDTDLVPAKREDASGESFPLHPYGSYLHVCYGIQTGRASQVFVGVGVFRVTNAKRNLKDATVTVKGRDFALNLKESRVAYPVTRQSWDTVPPTPFTVLAVAQAIISEAGLAYRTPTASSSQVAVNYLNKKGDERTRALSDLAGSLGWTWYFDIDGYCYFGAAPDLVADPVSYTFDDGLVAQIVERGQELDRSDTYDVVIASDTAGLYIGGAYDANPDSVIARSAAQPASLYFGAGQFSPGGKPFFFASPVIASQPGAESAARTRLPAVALPAEGISATSVVIPDLRPGKMIAMARDGESTLVKWQVSKVTLPLAIGPVMAFDALTIAEPVDAAT